MNTTFSTIRNFFHYIKGKDRFLYHTECVIEGISYVIEKDLTNDTQLVIMYNPKNHKANISYINSRIDVFNGHIPKIYRISKKDFNMALITAILGITNILPFEDNEDQSTNTATN